MLYCMLGEVYAKRSRVDNSSSIGDRPKASFEKFSVPARQKDTTGLILKLVACTIRNAMMWW